MGALKIPRRPVTRPFKLDWSIWAIVSALRGPDRGSAEELKAIFTGGFRYFFKRAYSVRGRVDYLYIRRDPVTPDTLIRAIVQAREWEAQDSEGYHHYLLHLIRGLSVIADIAPPSLRKQIEALIALALSFENYTAVLNRKMNPQEAYRDLAGRISDLRYVVQEPEYQSKGR